MNSCIFYFIPKNVIHTQQVIAASNSTLYSILSSSEQYPDLVQSL